MALSLAFYQDLYELEEVGLESIDMEDERLDSFRKKHGIQKARAVAVHKPNPVGLYENNRLIYHFESMAKAAQRFGLSENTFRARKNTNLLVEGRYRIDFLSKEEQKEKGYKK